VSLLGRVRRLWTGKTKAAERAELEGHLADAVRLWMDAGEPLEAARVMVLRGDSEADPHARLPHYTQARATAGESTNVGRDARQKRARLVVAIAKDGALSSARKRDVSDAAEELLRSGDAKGAAEAFALVGDAEGQARALVQSGDVDQLEELLTQGQDKETRGHVVRDMHGTIEALVLAGQRREALTLAERAADDGRVASQRARLTSARVLGPIVRLTLQSVSMTLVLGDEVTIGRTEGAIVVASNALSRRHVSVFREGGAPSVRDLGSRNATQLRGQNVAGTLRVHGPLSLMLGSEVPLNLAPASELAEALALEVGGDRYVAPLGEARLGIDAWRLVVGDDRWVELVTLGGSPAYRGEMELSPRVTLLRGDALSATRGGEVVLTIDG
jgi:FHA domain